MEIGINGRTFSTDERGGPVQVGVVIATWLTSSGTDHVHLFGATELGTEFQQASVHDEWFVNHQIAGLLWEQFVLPRTVGRMDLDVLYCPNGNSPIFEIETPVVVCIHDIMNYLGYSSDAYRRLQRFRLPRVVAAADAIVAISEFTKNELVTHLSVPPEDIHVIHNGIDDTFLSDAPGTPLELPEEYILFVGGFHPRKNIGTLYRAYDTLREEHDISEKLVIIGPEKKMGHSAPSISLSTLANDPDVVLKGFVSQAELKYAYQNASLFTFLSEYEGFGLPPLEAMACGAPVVSSNRTTMPEVLGDAAQFVDPEDTSVVAAEIANVLRDSKLQSELKRKGKERARAFDWDTSAQKVRDVLSIAVE